MNNLTGQGGQGSLLNQEEVPVSLNFLETDDDSESISSPEKLVIDEKDKHGDDLEPSSHRTLNFSKNDSIKTPLVTCSLVPIAERCFY